jgi:parvulin-like peptidyl-prolyl isomerase
MLSSLIINHDTAMRRVSRSALSISGIFLSICLAAICGPGCGPCGEIGDRVVMVVGSRQIAVSELKRRMEFISSDSDLLEKQDALHDELIDQVIDHFLIMEYGKKQGISVSEHELHSALQQIKDDYTEDDFEEALLRGYTDYKGWEQRLKERLLVNKIIKKVTNGIAMPTDQEIRDYYKDNQNEFRSPEMLKFRQIVCTSKEEAEDLLKRLHDGENMKDLAGKYSVAPEAENGGEVGWVASGQLEESMEKALFSMPVGKISPVIKTPYGYHIFEVLDTRPERMKGLSDVRQEIVSRLLSHRQEAFCAKWLDELRSEFKIKADKEMIKALLEKS